MTVYSPSPTISPVRVVAGLNLPSVTAPRVCPALDLGYVTNPGLFAYGYVTIPGIFADGLCYEPRHIRRTSHSSHHGAFVLRCAFCVIFSFFFAREMLRFAYSELVTRSGAAPDR